MYTLLMKAKRTERSRQAIFREMILGILLYSVVLGFFNDYTEILYTGTYSTTFAAAIVLQLLTFATFLLKDKVVARFTSKEQVNKVGMLFSVWLIVFFSKFVFLWVIDIIFGDQVEISGFVRLLVIIVVLTLAQKAVEYIDKKLAD